MRFNPKIQKLLQSALDKRIPLTMRTNALRLINGQGDGLDGLVLEQYNKHFVAQIFNDFWLKETEALKDFIVDHFPVEYLILKDRTKSTASNPEAIHFKIIIDKGSSRTLVHENGVQFEVDLNDTLNTGLFLDMRSNRFLVAKNCKDKKVLNCFSYTCSFGVHARVQGASEVVNVDVSKKILEKGQRNYELNKIESVRNEFIKADALEYLAKAVQKNNFFDVIILDPPSFARHDKGRFIVQKDMAKLMGLAVEVLNEKGKLFVSTNFSGISCVHLEQLLKKFGGGRKFRNSIHLGQDRDFVGTGQVKESHLAAIWVEY